MERLDTTNVILIVLALVSVVQALVAIAAAIGAYHAYRESAATIDARLSPVLVRLETVLMNLEHTTAVVRTRTDDVNRAIDSVHNTAGRIGAAMWPRAMMVAGLAGSAVKLIKQGRARRASKMSVVEG